VIHFDTDKNPVLFADQILAEFQFDKERIDAKGYQPMTIIDNNYEHSTLRSWLNRVGPDVKKPKNFDSYLDSYIYQGGFLSNDHFSSKERGMIEPFTHKVLLGYSNRANRDGGSELHDVQWGPPDQAVTNIDRAYY
jgi:hypothetical protein